MAASKHDAQVDLTPPEYTYFNEVKASVGNDPNVTVDPLVSLDDGNYLLKLHVSGKCRAKALATLLIRDKVLGNIHVYVKVKNDEGKTVKPIRGRLKALEIAKFYKKAFSTNDFFCAVKVRVQFDSAIVYPIYEAQIIQFFNDDLSDYYSNYNNVAAFVFREVLKNEVSGKTVQFSTVELPVE